MSHPTQAATSGTDERLDLVIEELRALRADLAAAPVGTRKRVDALIDDVAAVNDEPRDGETVELRGSARTPAASPKGRTKMAAERDAESTTTTTTTTAAPKPTNSGSVNEFGRPEIEDEASKPDPE